MTTRIFVELDGNLRRRLEALIESLVDILDQIDGDADLEDGGDAEDEPAELSQTPAHTADAAAWRTYPKRIN
jgi:hypothetical protein